jgi:hypothetical protein
MKQNILPIGDSASVIRTALGLILADGAAGAAAVRMALPTRPAPSPTLSSGSRLQDDLRSLGKKFPFKNKVSFSWKRSEADLAR